MALNVKHVPACRTLAWALLSVLSLPLTALRETYEEARDLLLKWRQNVAELQHDLQRRQVGGDGSGGWRALGRCRAWGE